MKRITNLIKILIVGVALYLPSSCDYLNVDGYFNDMLPVDTVFAKKEYLERYIWGAAGLLPNEQNLYLNAAFPYAQATDEVQFLAKRTDYGSGMWFAVDEVTPFSDYSNNWETWYKGIRKANTVFTRFDECKDATTTERRELLGLTHFLRGYFYYHLLMQYGPVPILPDDPLQLDASTEELSYERNTYDECVDYICKDMEKASALLEGERTISELERPTKFAALAIISRLRLHAASPWFNGNTFYRNWQDSKGRHFMNQVESEEKWAKSAYISKSIINSGKFSIHTVMDDSDTPTLPNGVPDSDFPDGAGNIDPYKSFHHMFSGEVHPGRVSEYIWSVPMASAHITAALPRNLNGWSCLSATQSIVDGYKRNDGTKVEYVHNDWEEIGESQNISGYTLPGSAAKRYDNMEARFYATIAFCESYWPGLSYSGDDDDEKTKITATYYANGSERLAGSDIDDVNTTGYGLRKFVHDEDHNGGRYKLNKRYPLIRYAEVILNYVEAINELTKPYTLKEPVLSTDVTVERNDAEIMKYFNMIRYRAGLPGMTAAEAGSVVKVRELIKQERMVEFVQEQRRYHDVRRWGIALETDNGYIRGLDTRAESSAREDFYTVIPLAHIVNGKRVFTHKHFFYPIHYDILSKNRKLVQNPLW